MTDEATPPTRRKRKERPDYGWPAAMRRATAAAYLDMSEGAFLREVQAGRMPGSFVLGGRDHWRKDSIDVCIDRITGGADIIPDYVKEFCERHGVDPLGYWQRTRKA